MKQPSVTIVIPLFNEARSVPHLVDHLNVLNKTIADLDILFVDDGSSDGTVSALRESSTQFSTTILSLSRNFGHQAALLAGLETAKGDIVITMDGDLQHPPSLIPEMIETHKNGVDVVLTQRIDGSETGALKKGTAQLFYTLLNSISSDRIMPNGSDFRSLNRKALTALLAMPEKRKFLRGMVQWIGFTQKIIPFQVQSRQAGESKYSFFKMLKLAIHGITSFSTAPLYASAFFGLLLFIFALIYAVYVVYMRYFVGSVVEGWASVLFVQLLVGGFISFFLGVLGLYIAAIYDEVKERPTYIIAEKIEKKRE